MFTPHGMFDEPPLQQIIVSSVTVKKSNVLRLVNHRPGRMNPSFVPTAAILPLEVGSNSRG